jgi:MFS family permease
MSQLSHAVAGGATEESLTPGQHKAIFLASFLTLIAAGIGFAVRGAILDDWGTAFGFTKFELGTITGGGLTGFGITIIICSFFADRIGYKTVLTGAFILHVLSAVITLAAGLVFKTMGRDATYWTLFIGMFIFALGNGLCEAAINPLTATLYPKNKTHYLNILHAGWPAGLVLGAVFAFCFAGDHAAVQHLRWEIPMLFFLVPTLIYGLMVLMNPFPVSEAKAAGVSIGTQIATIFAPLLIFLFLIHGMVGYVELGTDSWITSIMNNVKTTISNWGLLLFIYVSTLMFILRFFAGPIVHKINPLGLLLLAACFGAAGLYLLGTVEGIAMIVIAGTVYALGKTFYWPTMLGVIGERFPKGGALAMGISGGIGMISAGMLGGPGIGYFQDRFASNYLKDKNVAIYDEFKTDKAKGFLKFEEVQGLDGSKVGAVKDGGAGLARDVEIANKAGTLAKDANLTQLNKWFQDNKAALVPPKGAPTDTVTPTSATVLDANNYGGRQALKVTALVPATMAVCYLLLVLFFAATGGYKPLHLETSGQEVAGPTEGL